MCVKSTCDTRCLLKYEMFFHDFSVPTKIKNRYSFLWTIIIIYSRPMQMLVFYMPLVTDGSKKRSYKRLIDCLQKMLSVPVKIRKKNPLEGLELLKKIHYASFFRALFILLTLKLIIVHMAPVKYSDPTIYPLSFSMALLQTKQVV